MLVVLDASAAIEIVLQRKKANALHKVLLAAEAISAPDLFVSEVANVFWKYHQFQNLPDAECMQGVNQALAIVDEFVPSEEIVHEAFNLALRFETSTYDMFYLALALQHEATLVTVDQRLQRLCRKKNISVVE